MKKDSFEFYLKLWHNILVNFNFNSNSMTIGIPAQHPVTVKFGILGKVSLSMNLCDSMCVLSDFFAIESVLALFSSNRIPQVLPAKTFFALFWTKRTFSIPMLLFFRVKSLGLKIDMMIWNCLKYLNFHLIKIFLNFFFLHIFFSNFYVTSSDFY